MGRTVRGSTGLDVKGERRGGKNNCPASLLFLLLKHVVQNGLEFIRSRNPWFGLVSVLGTEHRTSDSRQALYHLSYSSSSKQGLVKLHRP